MGCKARFETGRGDVMVFAARTFFFFFFFFFFYFFFFLNFWLGGG